MLVHCAQRLSGIVRAALSLGIQFMYSMDMEAVNKNHSLCPFCHSRHFLLLYT